jgi:hypothetical protein
MRHSYEDESCLSDLDQKLVVVHHFFIAVGSASVDMSNDTLDLHQECRRNIISPVS